MPYTDAYGRTISDDGRYVWDGQIWQALSVASPPFPLAPPTRRRSVWPIVAGVAAISVVGVIALAAVGMYALVRTPSYGGGYAQSYQQQRAADESLIASDVAACQSAPASCDRAKLRRDIRHERAQVAGLKSFPFTPPCLVPEMNSELAVLDRMYAASASSAGDSTLAADLEQLASLRGQNPCPA